MNVYLLLCALRGALEPKLATLPLPTRSREKHPPQGGPESLRSATVYIGDLPPKKAGEEIQPPFVVLQDLNGKHLDGFHYVQVGLRVSIWNEDPEGALNDLHNLMSLLIRACGAFRSAPLDGRYKLVPDDDGAVCNWFRPDEQNPPFREGYIITRWHMAGLE